MKVNPQLMTYALGAAKRYHNRGLSKVHLFIVQPLAIHPDGPVRGVTIDAEDLDVWALDAVDCIRDAHEENAPLRSGSECHFCKAAGACPELRKAAFAAAEVEFDDAGELMLEDPNTFSHDKIGTILRQADALEMWLKAVRGLALDLAKKGEKIPGRKLVWGMSHRKWGDTDAVKKKLTALGYKPSEFLTEPELKSPAQVDKLVGKDKKLLAEYQTKKQTELRLVSVSAKGEAVEVGPGVEFGDDDLFAD